MIDYAVLVLNVCIRGMNGGILLLGIGYGRYFRDLRDFLISQLGDQIEVLPKEDRGVTGNFEVTVLETGQVLHSKTKMGQGKATSRGERMAILDQIMEILDDE